MVICMHVVKQLLRTNEMHLKTMMKRNSIKHFYYMTQKLFSEKRHLSYVNNN